MNIGYKLYKPIETKEQLFQYGTVANWCDNNMALLEDKGEYYEVVKFVVPQPTISEQIAQLKGQLSATDYKCLKYVDGALSEEEYAETKVLRANLRQQINELEAQAN